MLVMCQTTKKYYDIDDDPTPPCLDNDVFADCASITIADCKKYYYYNTKYCCQTCKVLLKP